METVVVVKAAGMGVGGAGVIGATGYGAYKLIAPTNIREQLEWNGKVVLDTEGANNDTEWKTLVGQYPGTDKTKLSGLNEFATEDNDETKKMAKLKQKCKEELNTKLTDNGIDTKLKAAEDWCTKK